MRTSPTPDVVMGFILFALIIFFTNLCHCQDKNYTKVEAATHRIHVVDVYDLPSKGHCSGTAIAPHALLTAGHCLDNSNTIVIDDEPAGIGVVINDGFDHVIIAVQGVEFKKYAHVTQRDLLVSEDVFMIGNPAYLRHQYRRGVVSGTFDFDEPTKPVTPRTKMLLYAIDLNGFFGDSGAGIFDSKGDLVSTMSVRNNITSDDKDGAFMILLGAMKLHFTDTELTFAERYNN